MGMLKQCVGPVEPINGESLPFEDAEISTGSTSEVE
jgi:hypothetical protein